MSFISVVTNMSLAVLVLFVPEPFLFPAVPVQYNTIVKAETTRKIKVAKRKKTEMLSFMLLSSADRKKYQRCRWW